MSVSAWCDLLLGGSAGGDERHSSDDDADDSNAAVNGAAPDQVAGTVSTGTSVVEAPRSAASLAPEDSSPATDAQLDSMDAPRPKVASRCHNWSKPLCSALRPVRLMRGNVLRNLRVASLCTGLGPEAHVFAHLKLPADFVFTSDNKVAAYQFTRANGPCATHHFVNAREVFDGSGSLCGTCANHYMAKCNITDLIGTIDILISGVSCKPYTMARTGRFDGQGSNDHSEIGLIHAFVDAVRRLRPLLAVFENVCGMMMPTSRSDPKSPLQYFVEDCAKQLHGYHIVVFLLNANSYTVFHRRRLYLLFISEAAGGKRAAADATCFVKAQSN